MESPSPSEPAPHEHAPGESCPKCWAQLETPLFCESCHELLAAPEPSSPFETLGLAPGFPVDQMALRKRLLQLSRQLHPDFHGAADTRTRALAERNTAELNAAFEILESDFRRADWLVRSLGGPSEAQERQMPSEFLAEVLDWNETIEEARSAAPGSPQRDALGTLGDALRAQRAATIALVSELLTPLPTTNAPELTQARRKLNAVRYLDRALREITELGLQGSPPLR